MLNFYFYLRENLKIQTYEENSLQLFAVAILSVSCASEDLTVQNNSERKVVTLNKTTEMLDFEKSLKDYFKAKRENSENLKNYEEVIVKQSRVLLSSIGISESEIDKNAVTTESLISYTLKNYSVALSKLKSN